MSQRLCKLTKKEGKFVKSHIIPRAFTKPIISGNYFLEFGESKRPKKRWSSWYDKDLVIREGEDILSDYDNFAVQELRNLKLVWHSWEQEDDFASSIKKIPGLPSFGLRKVICTNPEKLRLFFLSLLWRSASTSLTEFSKITLKKNELEKLRKMLIEKRTEPLGFFPISLLQIASKGHTHNFIPIALDELHDDGDGGTLRYHVFRFYFDGLIINIHRSMSNIIGCESLLVGCNKELVVQQQLYEDSFQYANLKKGIIETGKEYYDR